MDEKSFEQLRIAFDLKNRNGIDSEEEFWKIIKEYTKHIPYITDSELWQIQLHLYSKVYASFPDMDADMNIRRMIRYFKKLIDEFENNVCGIFPEKMKKDILSQQEERLSILLKSMSDVIFEYVGDFYVSQHEEDESISEMVESYLDTLKNVDIVNINVKEYYCNHMMPFYRYLYKKIKEALNDDNKDILKQIATLIVNELVLRIDMIAYCISE